MLNPHDRREIQDLIKQYISIILPALAGETASQSEGIDQLYPGMPVIENRPIMHPYGYISRAPVGTNSLTARVAEHTSARVVIGHLDVARKDIVLGEGENALYNNFGQQIVLKDGKINLGKDADQPAVLGTELVALLGNILDALIAGQLVTITTPGNLSAPNPALVAQATAWKAQYLTTAASNILSQEVFVERVKL